MILDDVVKNGGEAILTGNYHQSGTDRIFEVFYKEFKNKTDIIINLQGDLPNVDHEVINAAIEAISKNDCDIVYE